MDDVSSTNIITSPSVLPFYSHFTTVPRDEKIKGKSRHQTWMSPSSRVFTGH